jgi:UDPglucose 6-dehydrogenase
MKTAIVGSGYVGVVSGVCLAAKGHDVTCVDIEPAIVAALNSGRPNIYERDLEGLLRNVLEERRFRATTNLSQALNEVDAVIIAVGTPTQDGVIDLSYVRKIAGDIGLFLKESDKFLTTIVKSTVLPGTTDEVVGGEIAAASGKRLGDFGLGMNPEFLREGQAIVDFLEPDRIVMGYEDQRSLSVMQELYAPWNCDKLFVNTRTAELIKYANNALLATQISAINEMANLAAAIGGVDIMDVVKGVHLDKRWSPIYSGHRISPSILTYLVPGCGFGGSCFPKDVQALRSQGKSYGLPMHMLGAILEVNENQPLQVADILEREIGDLSGRACLLLGLAFKPETDDVRNSASIKIAETLLTKRTKLAAHDPMAINNFKRAIGERSAAITFVDDWRSEVTRSEIIIIATQWQEYLDVLNMNVENKLIFDARRLLAARAVEKMRYLSIGRRT